MPKKIRPVLDKMDRSFFPYFFILMLIIFNRKGINSKNHFVKISSFENDFEYDRKTSN